MWLPLTRPLLGTWPATQACALTGNLIFFLRFHRQVMPCSLCLSACDLFHSTRRSLCPPTWLQSAGRPLFSRLRHIPLHAHTTPSRPIHPSWRTLRLSHGAAIVHDAAVHVGVRIALPEPGTYPSDEDPEVELLGHVVGLFLIF